MKIHVGANGTDNAREPTTTTAEDSHAARTRLSGLSTRASRNRYIDGWFRREHQGKCSRQGLSRASKAGHASIAPRFLPEHV